jgi:hypothetical protein
MSKCDDGMEVLVTLKLVGELTSISNNFMNVMNLIARKCLRLMGLTQLGRGYFDPQAKVILLFLFK